MRYAREPTENAVGRCHLPKPQVNLPRAKAFKDLYTHPEGFIRIGKSIIILRRKRGRVKTADIYGFWRFSRVCGNSVRPAGDERPAAALQQKFPDPFGGKLLWIGYRKLLLHLLLIGKDLNACDFSFFTANDPLDGAADR